MKFAAISLFTLLLLSTPDSGLSENSAVTPEKWFELRNRLFSEGREKEDLTSATIPLLISPELEKNWGSPAIHILDDGSYTMRYQNPDPDSPFEAVTILGFATPLPSLSSAPGQLFDELVNGELSSVERPGKWKSIKVTIAGDAKGKRRLQFFREYAGGGADGPRDSTDTFQLTADGQTGHYVVIVDTLSNATKKRLKTLALKRQ